MNEIELTTELNYDLALELAALRDELPEDEILDYLSECVKRGIHAKFEEIADE